MGSKLFFIFLLYIHIGSLRSLGDDVCKRCRISRTHGMKSIDCYDKDIRKFPDCIPSDVEVLELSTNRIQKLTNADLTQFSYLKFLYLRDNFLVTLQDDTFEDMNSLRVIDLSQNHINIVPPSVFKIPSLDKLYLSQNSQLNTNFEDIKPIESPISTIDISCTTEEHSSVPHFPDFGPMPYLVSLNISENQYRAVAPKNFADLCSLEILINDNVSVTFENGCDCWLINNWLTERKVQFKTFMCPVTQNECKNKQISDQDMAIYEDCLEIIEAIEKEHRVLKISIGVGVSVLALIIVAFFVYFYFIRKKRRGETNTKIVKTSAPLDILPDGPLLLNANTKSSTVR